MAAAEPVEGGGPARAASRRPSLLPVLFLLGLPALLVSGGCAHSKTELELAETYYNLGNAYSESGQWEKAGEAYLRAIELDPTLRRAGFQMARVYVQAGEYGKAEEMLRRLREQDPENQRVREYLAWVYVRSGRREEARSAYEAVLEENPADCDVRYNLALLESEDQRWRRSIELLEECLRYGEEDAQIYRLLGSAELELGQQEAVGYLEKAYEMAPSLEGLAGELARAYRLAERYGKAVDMYDTILGRGESAADRGEILFQKAFVLLTAIEDYERGIESLRAALEAGFRDDEQLEELLRYPRLLDPGQIEGVLEEYGALPEQSAP